ncbi:hypothetical protein QBC32DRAFT_319037 [Pseudoneurospora amorphoporcata]|uniref:Uncharacterized protein n=1 Tax=Pseudoneurospora amorphoporcata TaxID=241081 RepID=A0AAN6NK12_9PEZI|nr:hypothetical protein QBC32DRAFT_319037 [Pseudoneurospora amorphoporcata]
MSPKVPFDQGVLGVLDDDPLGINENLAFFDKKQLEDRRRAILEEENDYSLNDMNEHNSYFEGFDSLLVVRTEEPVAQHVAMATEEDERCTCPDIQQNHHSRCLQPPRRQKKSAGDRDDNVALEGGESVAMPATTTNNENSTAVNISHGTVGTFTSFQPVAVSSMSATLVDNPSTIPLLSPPNTEPEVDTSASVEIPSNTSHASTENISFTTSLSPSNNGLGLEASRIQGRFPDTQGLGTPSMAPPPQALNSNMSQRSPPDDLANFLTSSSTPVNGVATPNNDAGQVFGNCNVNTAGIVELPSTDGSTIYNNTPLRPASNITPNFTGSVAPQLLPPSWMTSANTLNVDNSSSSSAHNQPVTPIQTGASRCFQHLQNRPGRRIIALIIERHLQGIWSCTNSFRRTAPNSNCLCHHCITRKREDRANRKKATVSTQTSANPKKGTCSKTKSSGSGAGPLAISGAKLPPKGSGVLTGRILKTGAGALRKREQSVQDDEEGSDGDEHEAGEDDYFVDKPMHNYPFNKDSDPDSDGGSGGFGAPETVSQLVF